MVVYKESVEFAGREFSIEVGLMAKQASGAAFVSYGDSRVLATAQISAKDSQEASYDFTALTVEYIEKTYAAGKIPGGFFKREGRQLTHEILISRMIDRPVRPLIPKTFKREIQLISMVLSSDGVNDTDVMALCGTSAALMFSECPFDGPIAGVKVALIDGEYVANPTREQRGAAKLNLFVAASKDAIVMVEGEAEEASEEEVIGALMFAHKAVQPVIDLQMKMYDLIGKPKIVTTEPAYAERVKALLKEPAEEKLKIALKEKEKLPRYAAVNKIEEECVALLGEEAAELGDYAKGYVAHLQSEMMREQILERGVRVDGRDLTTVRPIDCKVGVLPRSHGSALFTRGETQALATVTLGTKQDIQIEDVLFGETEKKFMLHYNFLPFSVGEVKRLRSPSRREIGHGNLAERSIKNMLPKSEKDFPYIVRIVSEILESNGSSSMATICASSMALMDAGVPVKKAVAGVAMGLIKSGDKSVILTDIIGDEDHLGDMDFKVAGTVEGITAIQMDIKIKGLSEEILRKALMQAKEGRLHILDLMNKAIDKPRPDLSPYAPRITVINIPTDKIRDVIGSGGKVIRGIIEETGVTIDINDNGEVFIASSDAAASQKAIDIIRGIAAVAEVGKVYKGVVTRIADFGAFVEIFPGTEGLLHISQVAKERIRRVEDVLKEGDEVEVLCLEVDERSGKIRLSRKALLEKNR